MVGQGRGGQPCELCRRHERTLRQNPGHGAHASSSCLPKPAATRQRVSGPVRAQHDPAPARCPVHPRPHSCTPPPPARRPPALGPAARGRPAPRPWRGPRGAPVPPRTRPPARPRWGGPTCRARPAAPPAPPAWPAGPAAGPAGGPAAPPGRPGPPPPRWPLIGARAWLGWRARTGCWWSAGGCRRRVCVCLGDGGCWRCAPAWQGGVGDWLVRTRAHKI